MTSRRARTNPLIRWLGERLLILLTENPGRDRAVLQGALKFSNHCACEAENGTTNPHCHSAERKRLGGNNASGFVPFRIARSSPAKIRE